MSMGKRAAADHVAPHDRVRVSQREMRIIDSLEKLTACGIGAGLAGPAKCGKSTIAVAFSSARAKEIVRVHAGEASDDARALLGSHILSACADGGVSFMWQDGPVLRALRNGLHLVIEDLHVATAEVCAVLLPVVQRRAVCCPALGADSICALESFAIVATFDRALLAAHHMPIVMALEVIDVPPLTGEDVDDILRHCHPQLDATILLQLGISHAALFKLASRLSNMQLSGALTSAVRAGILLDALDCAAGHLPRPEREAEARRLAALLSLSDDELSSLLSRHPSIAMGNGAMTVGRVMLPARGRLDTGLAQTLITDQMLERVAAAVANREPVLLVGEAGAGKTSIVQHLARAVLYPRVADDTLFDCAGPPLLALTVVNMSQQSEGSDLLGAYRPVAPGQDTAARLRAAADSIRERFLALFASSYDAEKNSTFVQAVTDCAETERLARLMAKGAEHARSLTDAKLREAWAAFEDDAVRPLLSAVRSHRPAGRFAYVEGVLTRAAREGTWVLLDEINLATGETLQLLGGLLERMQLSNRTDTSSKRAATHASPKVHSDFRIFACMNPGGTDVGKRVLPPGIRAAFTELWMDDADCHAPDVALIIAHSTARVASVTPVLRQRILDAYYALKTSVAAHELVDAQRRPPLLNLRTLVRALAFVRRAEPLYGPARAAYEGLCMAFGTALDDASKARFVRIVAPLLIGTDAIPPLPNIGSIPKAMTIVEKYVLPSGPCPLASEEDLAEVFLLTPSARSTVASIARALMAGPQSVLLEGPTSAGKTSAVEYIARRTGHRCVRVNNSEHTDVAQYIGGYSPDHTGSLVFHEGLLVRAVRAGDWVVLDELNLAPSDVLEALNRLLDDNRQLFVPDTGETIDAHPGFRLFATQNPAASGIYGGRKVLSRAFRSRFVEVSVGDLPVVEVEAILVRRGAAAGSPLAPSHAKRLADAYRLLQERRGTEENVFAGRHALVTLRDMFRWAGRPHGTIEELALNGFRVLAERLRNPVQRDQLQDLIQSAMGISRPLPVDEYNVDEELKSRLGSLAWTRPMLRLFNLVHSAIGSDEPVLLVGETGTGKTSVCQAVALATGRELVAVNCHANTEVADLIGALRPARSEDGPAFAWQDGPLVRCMREGQMLLLDEISLADDSVLERINSVLEPGRTLTLVEASLGEESVIRAHPRFCVVATMNPGGDYGKKELSPALRNRFTEVWISSIGDEDDLVVIVSSILGDAELAQRMVSFVSWWRSAVLRIPALAHWPFSMRDVIGWARFVASLAPQIGASSAAVHAAASLFVDPALSVARGAGPVAEFQHACVERLNTLFGVFLSESCSPPSYSPLADAFGSQPFMIPCEGAPIPCGFSFDAKTVSRSAVRILRGMHLGRAVLLEGSPGVGKSSIVSALAAAVGKRLTRINLSEQTDIVDLFGADMPVASESGATFAWIDGPFLAALRRGDWILLDELNLASQSVLEGLNAVLDHRGTVYIPELDRTFEAAVGTRIFAAQNPLAQGGGRKGLPRSFLNRFVTVWVDPLTSEDMVVVLSHSIHALPRTLIEGAVAFNERLTAMIVERRVGIAGGPWECNLRDLQRWMAICSSSPDVSPLRALYVIYGVRMHTAEDRAIVRALISSAFGVSENDLAFEPCVPRVHNGRLLIGCASLEYSPMSLPYAPLPSQCFALEALAVAVQHAWPCILVEDYGESACGKSGIVKCLGAIGGLGTDIVELTLSPDTETADLLGSFEQCGNETLSFQWRDGPLVSALEQGKIIVLDRANQCSPSVLDRLNALLEPNGVLVLSEAATTEPRIVVPHKNARVIMICSGIGELSRAMRNRGLEISLSLSQDADSRCITQMVSTTCAAGVSDSPAGSELLQSGLDVFESLHRTRRLAVIAQRLGCSVARQICDGNMLQSLQFREYAHFWLKYPETCCVSDGVEKWFEKIVTRVLEQLSEHPALVADLYQRWLTGDLSIHVTPLAKSETPLSRVWRRFWRQEVIPIAASTVIGTGCMLPVLASLPLCTDIDYRVKELAKQLAIVRGHDILPIETTATLLKLRDTVIRLSLLGMASAPYRLERTCFIAVAAAMDGDLDVMRAASVALDQMEDARRETTLSSHVSYTQLLVAVHSVAPRLASLFATATGAIQFVLADDETVAIALCEAANVPLVNSVAGPVVSVGMSLLRALGALYALSDPVPMHYAPKAARLHAWLREMTLALDAQRTIRLRLFGDTSVPREFEDNVRSAESKLQTIASMLEALAPVARTNAADAFDRAWNIVARAAADDFGADMLPNLLRNARSARERLCANLPADVTMLLGYCLDLVVIGLELYACATSGHAVPYRLAAPTNGSAASKMLCVLEHARVRITFGDDGFILNEGIRDSLGAAYNEVQRDETAQRAREAARGASFVFKSIEDDEEKDAKLAESLFSNSTAIADSLFDVAHAVIVDRAPFPSAGHALKVLLPHVAPVRRLVIRSMPVAQPTDPKYVNVYTHHSVSECDMAMHAVATLAARTSELLDLFPEQDMLQTLSVQCARFASQSFGPETTISVLISAVETLLTKAQAWEANADRAHSTMEASSGLVALVIRWRKMELQGWRCQLDAVDEAYARSAHMDVLWLLQLLSRELDDKNLDLCADGARLIDTYLVSAPAGQFSARLETLRKLGVNDSITQPGWRLVIRALVAYYDAGVGKRMAAIVASHRRAVAADLRAVLVDTVWRDRTYWAVQQTVARTHRLVARQVRRYRDRLDTPVSILLSREPFTEGDVDMRNRSLPVLAWKTSIPLDGLNLRAFNRLGAALQRLDASLPVDAPDCVATMAAERLAELSAMTSKDAVQMRQKALVSLLRTLRHGGLRLALAPEAVSETAANVPGLVALSAVWEGQSDMSGESHLSRAISRWRALCDSKIHDDVGPRQAEAMRNAVFHLLYNTVLLRVPVKRIGDAAAKLSQAVKRASWMIEKNEAISILRREEHAQAISDATSLACDARLGLALAGPHKNAAADTCIQRLVDLANGVRTHLMDCAIFEDGRVCIATSCLSVAHELISEMRALPLSDVDLDDVLAPLAENVAKLTVPTAINDFSQHMDAPRVVHALQLCVQDAEDALQQCAFATDLDEYDMPHGLLSGVHVSGSWSAVVSVADRARIALEATDFSAPEAADAHRLAQTLQDFFSGVQARLVRLHRGTSKMALIVAAIAQRMYDNGFCRPPPSEATDDAAEGAGEGSADGTGMADGTGDKNVSEQIEFEEQITDLMRDEKPQEEKQEDGDHAEDEERLEMRDDLDEAADEQQKSEPDEGVDAEDKMDNVDHPDENKDLDDGWDAGTDTGGESEAESDGKDAADDAERSGQKEEEKPMDYDPDAADDREATKENAADETGVQEHQNDTDLAPAESADSGPEQEEQAKEEETEVPREDTSAESDQEIAEDEGTDAGEENAADDAADNVESENGEGIDEEGSEDVNVDETNGEESADERGGESKEQYEEQADAEDEHGCEDNAQGGASTGATKGGAEAAAASGRQTSRASAGHSRQRAEGSAPRPMPADEAVDKLCASVASILAAQSREENTQMEVDAGDALAEQAADGPSVVRGASTEHRATEMDVDVPMDAGVETADVGVEDEQEPPTLARAANDTRHEEEITGQAVPPASVSIAETLSFATIAAETEALSQELCESLRLVLEPTKATRLRGDYRSGRRLNLRRIPAYIASSYRRDKIWLRRTRPSARTYAVMLSVDNSRSMRREGAGQDGVRLALASLATVAQALGRLEVGSVGVASFGSAGRTRILKPLSTTAWTPAEGQAVFDALSFDDESTDVAALLSLVTASLSEADSDAWRLHLILSDGIVHDHAGLVPMVNASLAARIVPVFVVLDPGVAEMRHVAYNTGAAIGAPGVTLTRYLDTFPFPYYVLVPRLDALPAVLSGAIRQFFESASLQ